MSILDSLVRAQGQADERLVNSTQYAANAWGGLMEGLVYKAAGKELLTMMESKPDGLEAKDIMGLAQKYKLNEESLNKLFGMVKESGGLTAMNEQLRAVREARESRERVKGAQPAMKRALSSATNTGKFSLESYMNQMGSLHPELTAEEALGPAKAYADVENAASKGEMTDYQAASLMQRQADAEYRNQQSAERLAFQKQVHEDNLFIKQLLAGNAAAIKNRVPPKVAQEISDKAQGLDELIHLNSTFKDEFGGSVVGGPTATKLYERVGFKKDRVYWWKQFKKLDSKLRNELFGSALTATEKASWDEITVTENSDPEIIKEAIFQRASIAKKALDREIQGLANTGLDTSGMSGIVPQMGGTGVEVVKPASPSQTIRYDSTGKRVQ